MSSPTVFVHVGAPKTGTTYLQDRMARNAARLAAGGLHFPDRARSGNAPLFHFQAALDLLGQDWGGPAGHAEGAWDAMVRAAMGRDPMVRRVRQSPGTVVISHEILANAKAEHINRLTADLADAEVHVIYTARDLARQVPAAWQESIKQGRTWSFAKFCRRAQKGTPWFMQAFDLPKVIARWTAVIPAERVHVITVPQAGAPRDELWRRFCSVVGVDPDHAREEAQRINQSMGIEQTQMLRKLNIRLMEQGDNQGARRGGGDLDQVVMAMLEQGAFSGGRRSITLPPDLHPWALGHSERWIDAVREHGVDLVGDLDELRPAAPDPEARWHDPDRPRKKKMANVGVDALADFAREAARRDQPERALAPRVRRTLSRWTKS